MYIYIYIYLEDRIVPECRFWLFARVEDLVLRGERIVRRVGATNNL